MGTAIVATAFGGPEVLQSVPDEARAPGRREVTVRVEAAAVNPVDYKLYGGAFGTDPAKLPMSLGLEGAGVVTAVGPGAVGRHGGVLHVGDDVIVSGEGANGLYADAVTVADATVVPRPAELGRDEAAGLLTAGATAVHALSVTRVDRGDTVLIHGGAGSVGQLAVQLAVRRGARVIATAAESRHAQLRQWGAEPVTYGPGLADRVRAVAPEGVSAAIDTVGSDEAVDVSLELVPDRSRIATIAAFARARADGFPALGGGPGADPGADIRAAAWAELVPAAAKGELEIVIARVFPLAQAADAHRFVQEGHAGGKVILHP